MRSLLLILCVFNGFMQPDDRLGTRLTPAEMDFGSDTRITYSREGMAVSRHNRLFVNFPRTGPEVEVSVGEIQEDGKLTPFPDAGWNETKSARKPGKRFLNVQDLLLDANDVLWVLDSGNPLGGDIVEGGAKLVKIDIQSKSVEKVFIFDSAVLREESFLDDLEIDVKSGIAVVTDSGTDATLIVHLDSGYTERLTYGSYARRTGMAGSKES